MVHEMVESLCEQLKSLMDPLAFLMELLQNAEDAKYKENTVPAFDFYLYNDDPSKTDDSVGAAVIVINEAGFSSRDVWQLSMAGLSFKKLGKDSGEDPNAIGEKGLGFS
jgi:hypothetical protein